MSPPASGSGGDGRQVFISFKTEDRASAARVKDALVAAGHDVWWQENIQCGREWHGDIDAALARAACIVVLWSPPAMGSPWVRHEASQAIARNRYVPARLEPFSIESPYDRLQATDLDGWDGSPTHAGFARLLARVDELVPSRPSVAARAARFFERTRWTIASLVFAGAALALLVRLAIELERQVATQSRIAEDVRRSLEPLDRVEITAALSFPTDAPGVAEYVATLERTLGPASTHDLPPGVKRLGSGVLAISPQSALWPASVQHPGLAATAERTTLSFSVRRGPAGAGRSDAPGSVVHASHDDLAFDVASNDPDGSNREDGWGPSLRWEPDRQVLLLQFTDGAASRFWRSNGRVASVPDFEQALIEVTVKDGRLIPPAGGDAGRRIEPELRLQSLSVHDAGRSVSLDAGRMEVFRTATGWLAYRLRLADAPRAR